MWGLPLHVKHPTLGACSAEQLNKRDQGNLGSVAPSIRPIEHGLARKQAADTYAIEAAGQLTVGRPGFYRVHDATPMEPRVDTADIGGDPTAGPSPVSTPVKHGAERRVDAHLITLDLRSERVIRSPSSGRIARSNGEYQPIKPSRMGIGNTPHSYAARARSSSKARDTPIRSSCRHCSGEPNGDSTSASCHPDKDTFV